LTAAGRLLPNLHLGSNSAAVIYFTGETMKQYQRVIDVLKEIGVESDIVDVNKRLKQLNKPPTSMQQLFWARKEARAQATLEDDLDLDADKDGPLIKDVHAIASAVVTLQQLERQIGREDLKKVFDLLFIK